jgi:hypothetical protein
MSTCFNDESRRRANARVRASARTRASTRAYTRDGGGETAVRLASSVLWELGITCRSSGEMPFACYKATVR